MEHKSLRKMRKGYKKNRWKIS